MLRLFVAIDPPEDARDRLAGLSIGLPGANWVEPDNIHLTLRFIGEVDGAIARDVDMALDGVSAPGFDLTLAGVGHFETKGVPRAVWVGVERNAALAGLQQKIESALQRIGLPPEGRRFTPHVTLARLANAPVARVSGFLADHGLFRLAPFRVGGFTLFSSHLGRAGASYTPEQVYRLS